MREIRKVLGEIPILASEQRLLDEASADGAANGEEGESKEKEKEKAKAEGGGGRPKVLADGTYATETAFTSAAAARLEAVKAAAKPPLRSASVLMFLYVDALTISSFVGSSYSRRGFLYWLGPLFCAYEACPPFR